MAHYMCGLEIMLFLALTTRDTNLIADYYAPLPEDISTIDVTTNVYIPIRMLFSMLNYLGALTSVSRVLRATLWYQLSDSGGQIARCRLATKMPKRRRLPS